MICNEEFPPFQKHIIPIVMEPSCAHTPHRRTGGVACALVLVFMREHHHHQRWRYTHPAQGGAAHGNRSQCGLARPSRDHWPSSSSRAFQRATHADTHHNTAPKQSPVARNRRTRTHIPVHTTYTHTNTHTYSNTYKHKVA